MRYYSVLEVMNEATLAAASTLPSTVVGTQCAVIDLTECGDLALTVEAVFDENATADVVAHVRTSPYGGSLVTEDWDTEDFTDLTLTCVAGARVQVTSSIEADPKYMRVLVENEDATYPATDVIVTKVTSEGE